MTRGGKRFYIAFIDDYSRYTRMYLLRNKDESMDAFIKYKNEVENQLSKKNKRHRSDRGREYESNHFNTFCEEHGIIHETTLFYPPESNGVAKKKNRTLKEMMNAMLVSSGASLNLWAKLSTLPFIFKIEYPIIGLVILPMSYGKDMHLPLDT